MSGLQPGHILGIVSYGLGQPGSMGNDGLSVEVHLPQLNQPPLLEVWTSSLPVSLGAKGEIRFAETGELVFGCLESVESSGSVLEHVAESAYEQILDFCIQSGYQHLLRMWNFFPGINSEQNGLERYQRFCIGRHQGFKRHHREFFSELPAASAVGTQDGPFQVMFLAGKRKGFPLENPRQVSAYDYPSQYGPKSPSFARATLNPSEKGHYLFLAGTASIVGHSTQHHTDPQKQALETLANIEALREHAEAEYGECFDVPSHSGHLKVFVRNRKDFPIVKEVLANSELTHLPTFFLTGEICRKDLLVEIEGVWRPSGL